MFSSLCSIFFGLPILFFIGVQWSYKQKSCAADRRPDWEVAQLESSRATRRARIAREEGDAAIAAAERQARGGFGVVPRVQPARVGRVGHRVEVFAIGVNI